MVYNGTETLTFVGPRIWEIVPDCVKRSNNLIEFKLKIKTMESKKLSMHVTQKVLTTSWFFVTCLLIFCAAYFVIFQSHIYFANFKSVLSFIVIFLTQ